MTNIVTSQICCISLNRNKFGVFKDIIREAKKSANAFSGLDLPKVSYEDVFIQEEADSMIEFIFITKGEPYIEFFRVLSERFELIVNCSFNEPQKGIYGFYSNENGVTTEKFAICGSLTNKKYRP